MVIYPCFHRLHEPHSSCIHTNGCPCLSWHCQPHPVVARYGGSPSCLNHSSQTRLAKYRFPSTSPSRHSQCLSSRRLGRVCRLPLSPFRYRKSKHPTPMTTTPSPVFTGDTGYFKKSDFSDFLTGLTKSTSVIKA